MNFTSDYRARSAYSGFTLIEVMLAMLITAFVAMMAYQGLSAALTAAEGHEQQTQRLVELQLPWTVLERDIRHAVNRPVIDSYGDQLPALSGGELQEFVLRLTRRGRVAPAGVRYGDLQRVRYVLEDETLYRESWSVLDRSSEEETLQRTQLLDKIQRIELAFLDTTSAGAATSVLGGEWVEEWDKPDQLPRAVDIRMTLEDIGEVRRVFSIPFE